MRHLPLLLLLPTLCLASAACDENNTTSQDTTQNTTQDTTSQDTPSDSTASDTSQDSETAEDEPDTPTLITLPERPWSATEPGHYNIGYRELSVTYTPQDNSGERTLRLAVWYPTLETSGGRVAYLGILNRTGVFRNAAPAPDGPFPMLVYSHGSPGFAEASHFQAEFFARHGFLVVSPDHTGNTLANASDVRPPEMFYWRPWDISAVLDFVEALPSDDPLADLANTQQILLSGHSYGGYTTFATIGATFGMPEVKADCDAGTQTHGICAGLDDDALAIYAAGVHDPRIKIAAPMAAGDFFVFPTGGVADINIPVMHITAARDKSVTNTANGDPYWADLDGPDDIRIDFTNGGHHSFTDTCAFTPGIGLDDGCGPDFTPFAELHHAINAYTLAFARYHLLNDTNSTEINGLLEGSTLLLDDLTFEHK